MNWSYGVTTVPSRIKGGLLEKTLTSLNSSGLGSPLLFSDGLFSKLLISNFPFYQWVTHPNLGATANWIVTLTYLYVKNPKADIYAIFEDDILCVPGIKEYVEHTGVPTKGYLNLLTHDENLVKLGPNPTEGWHLSNQKGRGAAGLVFSRQAVLDLISSEAFTGQTYQGKNSTDGMVYLGLAESKYQEWVHYPSLLQHVGVSTLGHNYGEVEAFTSTFNPLNKLGELVCFPEQPKT
jgi:hypothetical protein